MQHELALHQLLYLGVELVHQLFLLRHHVGAQLVGREEGICGHRNAVGHQREQLANFAVNFVEVMSESTHRHLRREYRTLVPHGGDPMIGVTCVVTCCLPGVDLSERCNP